MSEEMEALYLPDGLFLMVAEMILPFTSRDLANFTHPSFGRID